MVKYVSSIEQEQYGALWLEGEKWRARFDVTIGTAGIKQLVPMTNYLKYILLLLEKGTKL